MSVDPPKLRPLRGDIDAWLTLTADLLITTALLQSSLSRALEHCLPWLAVLMPAVLCNFASALYARKNGLTALAFGPNTVFIVVFGRVILGPQNAEWMAAGWSEADRIQTSLALLSASLMVYAVVVAAGVLTMLHWRPVLPRRALVIPLAAICWTHLVGTSVQSLAGEGIAIWLPAALLFLLLFFTTKGPLTWALALGLWTLLSFVLPTSPSMSMAIAEASLPLSSTWLGTEAFTLIGTSGFWRDVFPLLAALGLANSFGVLENVAAAWEVGDEHSAKVAVGTTTLGTLLGALVGAAAPVTVYIGQPAFKARGARWLYAALGAVSLAAAYFALDAGFLSWFPIAVFHGAILYLGVMVGLLPRRYVVTKGELLRALLIASPIIAGWLGPVLGAADNPLLAWLGRGGGLISVAWGFLLFEDLSKRERTIVFGALAMGSALGLLHAPAVSTLALLTAALYLGLAALGPKLESITASRSR